MSPTRRRGSVQSATIEAINSTTQETPEQRCLSLMVLARVAGSEVVAVIRADGTIAKHTAAGVTDAGAGHTFDAGVGAVFEQASNAAFL